MGCGASTVAPPEAPKDPKEELRAECNRLRAAVRDAKAKQAELDLELSNRHSEFAYLNSTLERLGLLHPVMDDIVAKNVEQNSAIRVLVTECDVDELEESFKGTLSCNETRVSNVLMKRTSEDLQAIQARYREKQGQLLYKRLRGETWTVFNLLGDGMSDFGRLVTWVLYDQPTMAVLQLHRAMKGRGCNDKLLIEVLSTNTNATLRKAIEVYRDQQHEDMIATITKETKGFFGETAYTRWIKAIIEYGLIPHWPAPMHTPSMAHQSHPKTVCAAGSSATRATPCRRPSSSPRRPTPCTKLAQRSGAATRPSSPQFSRTSTRSIAPHFRRSTWRVRQTRRAL